MIRYGEWQVINIVENMERPAGKSCPRGKVVNENFYNFLLIFYVKLETEKIIFAIGGLILGFGILDIIGSFGSRFVYATEQKILLNQANTWKGVSGGINGTPSGKPSSGEGAAPAKHATVRIVIN